MSALLDLDPDIEARPTLRCAVCRRNAATGEDMDHVRMCRPCLTGDEEPLLETNDDFTE